MSVAENGLYVVMHWMEEQRREYMHNMRKIFYYLIRRERPYIETDPELGYLPGALGFFFQIATTRFQISEEYIGNASFLGFRGPGFYI